MKPEDVYNTYQAYLDNIRLAGKSLTLEEWTRVLRIDGLFTVEIPSALELIRSWGLIKDDVIRYRVILVPYKGRPALYSGNLYSNIDDARREQNAAILEAEEMPGIKQIKIEEVKIENNRS